MKVCETGWQAMICKKNPPALTGGGICLYPGQNEKLQYFCGRPVFLKKQIGHQLLGRVDRVLAEIRDTLL